MADQESTTSTSNIGHEQQQAAPRRRYPVNMEGVLRYAVDNTPDDATAERPVHPMIEEDKQFLQDALSEMGTAHPVERVKTIIKQVKDYLQTEDVPEGEGMEVEMMHDLLEELTEWCEQIDMACDFHKVGGFPLLVKLLESGEPDLMFRTGDLIATLCQNNPYCQEKVLQETDLLDNLMYKSEDGTQTDLVRTKCVLALSGIIRSNPNAQTQFIQKDGYSFLIRSMQTNINSLSTKATFLLRALMTEDSRHKDALTRMGCVEQLVGMLRSEHKPEHEHMMAALCELLTDNKAALADARRPDMGTIQFLRERQTELAGKEEYMEEQAFAKSIENLLTTDSNDDTMLNR